MYQAGGSNCCTQSTQNTYKPYNAEETPLTSYYAIYKITWPVTKYSVRVKIWSGRTKYASIFGPPPPQTVLLVAHAFRSVKARVTASETAREMCADENEDLVEKACLYLFDGRYPEGSTSNDKRVIRRKAATLTLRDGEVFYKKPKKNSTGQKVNIYVARSVWHPCIDGFDQTGGI